MEYFKNKSHFLEDMSKRRVPPDVAIAIALTGCKSDCSVLDPIPYDYPEFVENGVPSVDALGCEVAEFGCCWLCPKASFNDIGKWVGCKGLTCAYDRKCELLYALREHGIVLED